MNRLAVLLVAALPAIAAAQFRLVIEWGGSKPAPPAAEVLERKKPPASPTEVLDRPAEVRARPRVGIEEWSDPPPRPPARTSTAIAAEASAPRPELAGGVILRPSPASSSAPPAGGPAGRTFRQPDTAAAAGLPAYHAGHDCPRCGYTSPAGTGTWVVAGVNPDGTHTHRCPNCGATWRHRRE